jgi:hypothetical protein
MKVLFSVVERGSKCIGTLDGVGKMGSFWVIERGSTCIRILVRVGEKGRF